MRINFPNPMFLLFRSSSVLLFRFSVNRKSHAMNVNCFNEWRSDAKPAACTQWRILKPSHLAFVLVRTRFLSLPLSLLLCVIIHLHNIKWMNLRPSKTIIYIILRVMDSTLGWYGKHFFAVSFISCIVDFYLRCHSAFAWSINVFICITTIVFIIFFLFRLLLLQYCSSFEFILYVWECACEHFHRFTLRFTLVLLSGT